MDGIGEGFLAALERDERTDFFRNLIVGRSFCASLFAYLDLLPPL